MYGFSDKSTIVPLNILGLLMRFTKCLSFQLLCLENSKLLKMDFMYSFSGLADTWPEGISKKFWLHCCFLFVTVFVDSGRNDPNGKSFLFMGFLLSCLACFSLPIASQKVRSEVENLPRQPT